jgi:hypothetical protein
LSTEGRVESLSEEAVSLRAPFAGSKVIVPKHVVHRSFPSETVVLNLQTGKYHGLNPTAGAMLDALESTGSVAGASAEVAERFDLSQEAVEEDICRLCEALLERGLIGLDDEAQ